MKTAKQNGEPKTKQDGRVVQIHYTLSEPLEGHTDVVVSALTAAFDTGRPETYIFPATPDGDIAEWGELEGSYRGGTDHAKALRGAGYTIET